ncbi:MAG: hypothetical protein VXW65_09795 [Pseudomonadota bacterium]|nr:hypothetical protein [Pseudomonadota bacterium]
MIMQCIHQDDRREVWFAAMDAADDFYSPFDERPYVLLLINHDSGLSDADRLRWSTEIVSSNCRYAICAGIDGSIWDDTLDWAFVDTHIETTDEMLLTTWHDEEPFEDVLRFSFDQARFGAYPLNHYLVLCLGSHPRQITQVVADLTQYLQR